MPLRFLTFEKKGSKNTFKLGKISFNIHENTNNYLFCVTG